LRRLLLIKFSDVPLLFFAAHENLSFKARELLIKGRHPCTHLAHLPIQDFDRLGKDLNLDLGVLDDLRNVGDSFAAEVTE
jgi:hypothetical protein